MSKVASIEVVDKQDYPLIASFPLGVPNESNDMSLSVGQKQSGRSTKTSVITNLNGIKYKGTNYGEFNDKKDSCRFAVGIYNEQTGKFKITKTDHVFVMKPVFSHKTMNPERNSTMSFMERKNSLTAEFGSRKKKRKMQAALSNKISAENISGANAVENVLSVVKIEENQEVIKAAEQSLALRNKFKRPR
jgi:hypothetical protein